MTAFSSVPYLYIVGIPVDAGRSDPGQGAKDAEIVRAPRLHR